MHTYNMYLVINHVVNLYGLKAISMNSWCTFNMNMGVVCVLQSWVLPRYCINIFITDVHRCISAILSNIVLFTLFY